MFSKAVIDVDTNGKSYLSIKAIPSDDLRDKIFCKFVQNIIHADDSLAQDTGDPIPHRSEYLLSATVTKAEVVGNDVSISLGLTPVAPVSEQQYVYPRDLYVMLVTLTECVRTVTGVNMRLILQEGKFMWQCPDGPGMSHFFVDGVMQQSEHGKVETFTHYLMKLCKYVSANGRYLPAVATQAPEYAPIDTVTLTINDFEERLRDEYTCGMIHAILRELDVKYDRHLYWQWGSTKSTITITDGIDYTSSEYSLTAGSYEWWKNLMQKEYDKLVPTSTAPHKDDEDEFESDDREEEEDVWEKIATTIEFEQTLERYRCFGMAIAITAALNGIYPIKFTAELGMPEDSVSLYCKSNPEFNVAINYGGEDNSYKSWFQIIEDIYIGANPKKSVKKPSKSKK